MGFSVCQCETFLFSFTYLLRGGGGGGGTVCFWVSRHDFKESTISQRTIDQKKVKVYIFQKL